MPPLGFPHRLLQHQESLGHRRQSSILLSVLPRRLQRLLPLFMRPRVFSIRFFLTLVFFYTRIAKRQNHFLRTTECPLNSIIALHPAERKHKKKQTQITVSTGYLVDNAIAAKPCP